jgi:hypothetical protein
MPFTVYVEADASTNLIGNLQDPSAIQLWVSNVELKVFYSNSIIQLNTADISYSISNFYNSANAMNIAADVSVNTLSTDPTYNKFYAYGYGGTIQITNIILRTQPGYIYDMQLVVNFGFNVSDNFTTFFGNVPSICYAYLNSDNELSQSPSFNCQITNPLIVHPIPVFSLTGVLL